MHIRLATTDVEVSDCFPVMRELRPHIAENQFLSRIRSQMDLGYRLAFVQAIGEVVTIAGFRIGKNLAWGRFLYIDDLVTLPAHRSKGYGAKLLTWLRELAAKEGCQQLHLDSGTQRKGAHRFYERAGMTVASYHFVENVVPNPAHQGRRIASGASLNCARIEGGMIEDSMVTTALTLPSYRVVQSLGVVRGIIVRSRSIVGSFFGGLQTIFGGNITIYTNLCEQARAEAYRLMCQHGEERGASAIVPMRYDATEIMPGLTEVLCYKTAVVVESTTIET